MISANSFFLAMCQPQSCQSCHEEHDEGQYGAAHGSGEIFYKAETEHAEYDGDFFRNVVKTEIGGGTVCLWHQFGIGGPAQRLYTAHDNAHQRRYDVKAVYGCNEIRNYADQYPDKNG